MAYSSLPINPTSAVVDFIAAFVDARYLDTKAGVTGAVIAEEVRKKFPNLNLKQQIGTHWLGELVTRAEAERKVIRNHSVKHLEAYPPHARMLTSPEACDKIASARPYREHLRPDLWRAFVYVTQSAPTLFRKSDQQIFSPPLLASDNGSDYVEIKPIPEAVQQDWMSHFISKYPYLSAESSPVQAAYWWIRFPEWLRETDPSLVRDWNSFRTERVLDYARLWAKENDVQFETMLTSAKPQHEKLHQNQTRQPFNDHIHQEEAIRRAVLASVAELTLNELMSISIPVRCILRHFNAR